jgi:hypothetical protein
MTPSTKNEKKRLRKLDEKSHEAQAKADKLQRKALDNGKTKKAQRAQDKADKKMDQATSMPDSAES